MIEFDLTLLFSLQRVVMGQKYYIKYKIFRVGKWLAADKKENRISQN